MKRFGSLTICAFIVLLLPVVVQAGVETRQSEDFLPECIQQCKNITSQSAACFEQPRRDTLTCECGTAFLQPTVKQCIEESCMPKDIFAVLDAVTDVCHEPVRNKSDSFRLIISVFFSLAMTAILARFATHFTIGRTTWLDQSNMAVIFFLNIGSFICNIEMSYLGLGRDIWKVSPSNITAVLRWFWISEIVYFPIVGLNKTSFLLFYLQIFPDPRFRKVVWSCIVFNISVIVSCMLAGMLICSPVNFYWNQWDGEHQGHCGSTNHLGWAHAALGIVMDLIALALPVSQILNLQLSTKKKIGVMLMFGVGAFVTVVSILRLKSLVLFNTTTNITWDYLECGLWSVLEVEVGIICACLPSIRLGLTQIFPKMMGSTKADKSEYGEYGNGKNTHGSSLNSNWRKNGIGITTDVMVTHSMRPQASDQGSFVQLVEVDADAKSDRSDPLSGMK